MMKAINLTALAALVLCGAACADVGGDEATEDTDLTADSIVGGEIDKGHPAVVAIRFNKGSGSANCSGTLIAPTVVLTAAHCVAKDSSNHRVFFGSDVRQAKEADYVPTTKAVAHPDYKGTGDGHDAAVLVLSKPAPSNITPMPINRKALDKAFVGKKVLAVGFGLTDGNGKGEKGTKRKVQMPVTEVKEEEVGAGDKNKSVCNGDSGGPWFAVENGKETVVGITSWGRKDCRSGAWGTRVDKVLDLIEPYLKNTGGGGGKAPPKGDAGAPPSKKPPTFPGFPKYEDGLDDGTDAANDDEAGEN